MTKRKENTQQLYQQIKDVFLNDFPKDSSREKEDSQMVVEALYTKIDGDYKLTRTLRIVESDTDNTIFSRISEYDFFGKSVD